MDQKKLQEVFSDKAYVECIAKLSPEEAAKSLNEKGVEVTAEELVKLRDFMLAHKDEIESGELAEEALAGVTGGADGEAFLWGMVALMGTCVIGLIAAIGW